MKTFFRKKKNRVIASILVFTLVLTTLAVAIPNTFALKSTIGETFANPYQNDGLVYTLVEVGKSLPPRSLANRVNFVSNNPNVVTVTPGEVVRSSIIVTGGTKTGTAVISASTKTSLIYSFNYQVFDNSKIASYSLSNGGEIIIPTVEGVDDVESILTATSGAGDDVSDSIIWSSINTDIATITSDGVITPVAKGGAIVIGTVTDKWGIERQIPILVLIGNTSNSAIDDGEGNYYIPTDNAYVFIESGQDGKIKLPPTYVYDKDKDPSNGVDSSAYEKGGEFYREDPANSNIYKQIDDITGNLIDSPALWGGTTLGLGNDVNEQSIVLHDPLYYIDNGDNTFWGPVYSTNKGMLTGGGTSYNPLETPVLPIYTDADGKHYAGPFTAGEDQVYYGDPASGNGKLDSDEVGIKEDDVVYYRLADGTMSTVKPAASAVQGSDNNWYRPIGGGVWEQTTDSTGLIATQPEKYVGGNETNPDPNVPLYKITVTDNAQVPPASNYDNTYSGYLTTTPSNTCEKDVWLKAIVDAKTVSSISLVGNPKTEYYVGEKFNPDGLSIIVTYANGNSVEIPYTTTGVTFNPSTDTLLTKEDKIVTVTYAGQDEDIEIKVKEGIIPGMATAVDGTILSTSKTGDTSEWVEVARNGNYSLIVRSKSIGDSVFNEKDKGNVYSSSLSRDMINDWFDNKSGNGLPSNANLRNYTMSNTAIDNLGTYGNINGINQFSYPLESNGQQRTGSDIAFALSTGETANYCSMKWENDGSGTTASSANAKANWSKLSDGSEKWGLRTEGKTEKSAAYIDKYGHTGLYGTYYLYPIANRPALWVDSRIFD